MLPTVFDAWSHTVALRHRPCGRDGLAARAGYRQSFDARMYMQRVWFRRQCAIIWAHGVVVSHPLSMREALGSIPSVSIWPLQRRCVVPPDEATWPRHLGGGPSEGWRQPSARGGAAVPMKVTCLLRCPARGRAEERDRDRGRGSRTGREGETACPFSRHVLRIPFGDHPLKLERYRED